MCKEPLVCATEVIDQGDPRAEFTEMIIAKERKVKGLMDSGTYKIIPAQAIPNDANVLLAMFVFTIKSDDDVKNVKTRLAIRGHRNPMKKFFVHQSQNVQPSSIHLVLVSAVANKFTVWTSDVRQVYLQSEQMLPRHVFIKDSVKEFYLEKNEALQLLKPSYGLSESGNIWYETMDCHDKKDLKMNPFRCDPALYVCMDNENVIGISGTYVDDMIRAENTAF